MAEYEELRLTVTLVDNASAGLTKVQQQFKEISSGPTAGHIERLKRESSLLRDLMKNMGLEAGGAAKGFEALGLRAGAAVGGVVAVAGAIGVAAKALYDFSLTVEKTGQVAKQIGTSYAELKNISDQLYKQIGINEEESNKIVSAALQAQVQARRKGFSEMFDDIARALKNPQLANELRESLIKAATPADVMRAELEFQKKINDFVERNRGNKSDAQVKEDQASLRRQVLEAQHIDNVLQNANEIKNLDADRAKFLNELNERSKAYAELWRSVWTNVGNIKDLFLSDALDPNTSPFIALLKGAKELTDWIFKTMSEGQAKLEGKNFWEKFFYLDPAILEWFRKAGTPGTERGGPLEGTATGGAVPLLGDYSGVRSPAIDDHNETLDQNTRELKRLNDQLYTLLNPPDKAGLGGGGNAAADTGTPGPGSAPSGSAPSGSAPSAPGATPGTSPTVPAAAPPTGYSPSNPPPSGMFPGTPGLFEHSPMGIVPPGPGGGSGGDIPPNSLGFLRGIAKTESNFSWNEAQSDATNIKSYGDKTSQYDYGYLQMAQRDVDEAIRLGMTPEQAKHLMAGGKAGTSTLDEQMAAGDEYLKRRYPEAYKNLNEKNDYSGMVQATRAGTQGKSWKWFGLRDKPKEALQEYNKTRDATRVSAAAALGGSTTPLPGAAPPTAVAALPPTPPASTERVRELQAGATALRPMDAAQQEVARRTIDGVAGSRSAQRVNAEGHIQIEVPRTPGPSPGEQLFKRDPPTRSVQMQPAAVGPAEPSFATR